MTTYAIRGGEEGARRLDLLARVMAPTTESLLDRAGVAAGMRCLDLGCGGGHVSRSLATRAGAGGAVLGLDMDPVKLGVAQRESEAVGLRNVTFQVADVTALTESAKFDVVYGRFIVSHLTERRDFVARACRALRPTGVLVLEDIDFAGAFCHPANAAYTRSCELYREVIRRRGGDADVGPSLYGLCREAGLDPVEVQVVQPVEAGRDSRKSLMLSTLMNIADAVLAEAIATPDELQQTVADLAAFTEDDASIVACPRIFQVWGRRPSSSGTPV